MKTAIRIVLLLLTIILLSGLLPSAAPLSAAFAETLEPIPLDTTYVPYEPDPDAYFEDGSGYEDESISVKIYETRAYDTNILLAYITIADPSQIRTAFAGRFSSNQDVRGTQIAQRFNAVFAINADYYRFNASGYIVRQGVLYRDKPQEGIDILLIDENGDFHVIVDGNEDELAAFEGTIINSFNLGPALIIDGVKQDAEEPAGRQMAYESGAQRVVLAQMGPLSYLCVATEGPENTDSAGLTFDEIAEFMDGLGCQVAYNLDGGSSSTMILNNVKINALSSGKIRDICDIVYFATLVPSE